MTKDEQEALETVTKATVDSALEPLKTALTNVANPFTTEIGQLVALPFKWWRFKASFAILEKAKEFLRERSVNPQQVPIKLLAPILEYGSLEEDEDMTDKWAGLLASAADPDYQHSIMPSFAHILNELSPKEVFILQAIYCFVPEEMIDPAKKKVYLPNAGELRERVGLSSHEWNVALDNLHRLRLLDVIFSEPSDIEDRNKFLRMLVALKEQTEVIPYGRYNLTSLGLAFVRACCRGKIKPPEPRPAAAQ